MYDITTISYSLCILILNPPIWQLSLMINVLKEPLYGLPVSDLILCRDAWDVLSNCFTTQVATFGLNELWRVPCLLIRVFLHGAPLSSHSSSMICHFLSIGDKVLPFSLVNGQVSTSADLVIGSSKETFLAFAEHDCDWAHCPPMHLWQ